MAGETKIVFLDEPTTGLDPINRIQIWNILLKFKQKKSILLTTHLMEEADQLSDRIGFLNKGKILAVDTPTHLKT